MPDSHSRRLLLARGAALGSVGLAGCSAFVDGSDDGPTAAAEPDNDSAGSGSSDTADGKADEPNIGAVYIPFMGGASKWSDCAVGEPDVGRYSHEEFDFDQRGREATNTHIRQMRDHGISRVMFNFGEEAEDRLRLQNFKSVDRFAEIDLECYYVISQALRRDRDIERDFAFIRDHFLSEATYSTHDGRPVIQFWDVGFLTWGGNEQSRRVMDRIADEWGFGGFVDFLREELTVDGTDPFLVGDFFDLGRVYRDGEPGGETLEMVRRFDAASTWTGYNPHDETIGWGEALDHVEANFRGYRDLAERYDIDFVPTAFPGFDDRGNDCWGENRHLPRDPDGFRSVLALAEEYRTTELVNVATWNGWNEGHQIEPGSHTGEAYGTDFLEVVAEFSQPR